MDGRGASLPHDHAAVTTERRILHSSIDDNGKMEVLWAFRNGAVPVKLHFSIADRRDTIIRSRSLGACGRLYPPGVVRRSFRGHRGTGSGLDDCNASLVLRRNHDPGCVRRQALASVRGQRGGFRNGAVPVKLHFSIADRRDTIIRSRSLGACGRLYPPGVVRRSFRGHRGTGSGLDDCNASLVLRRNHDPGCVRRQALASVRGQRGGFRNGAVPVKLHFSIADRRDTIIRSRSLGACGRLYPPGVVRRSFRGHRGTGSGLDDCNASLVLRRNHDPGCVRRQALASVRGQRGGCQLHAWSKTIPECQSQSRASVMGRFPSSSIFQ